MERHINFAGKSGFCSPEARPGRRETMEIDSAETLDSADKMDIDFSEGDALGNQEEADLPILADDMMSLASDCGYSTDLTLAGSQDSEGNSIQTIWETSTKYLSVVKDILRSMTQAQFLEMIRENESFSPETVLALHAAESAFADLRLEQRIGNCVEGDASGDEDKSNSISQPSKRRGRKPSIHLCPLCASSFPYKSVLISHLKQSHQISRSSSVLYKRLGGDYETLKRLEEEAKSHHLTRE